MRDVSRNRQMSVTHGGVNQQSPFANRNASHGLPLPKVKESTTIDKVVVTKSSRGHNLVVKADL